MAKCKAVLRRRNVGSLVEVEWYDAQAVAGWAERFEAELAECRTAGYLVAVSDKGVLIAGTVAGEECNNVISIPLGWVVSARRLS